MNKVFLIGRITKDLDFKFMEGSGLAVGKFSLAIDRVVAKGKDKQTDFINCVAFGKTAELLANYTQKGSQLCVLGALQTSNYKDKEGKTVYRTDVVVNEIKFLDGKKKEEKSNDNFGGMTEISNVDIPFM